MKSREDDDLEFLDLDDGKDDLPEAEEDQDDEEELSDEELDEHTLRFVHRVIISLCHRACGSDRCGGGCLSV